MPNINRIASAVPPPPSQGSFTPEGCAMALVVEAVVFTVKTVVAFPPDLMMTLAGLRLQVGAFCAPVGEEVREQARLRVPE